MTCHLQLQTEINGMKRRKCHGVETGVHLNFFYLCFGRVVHFLSPKLIIFYLTCFTDGINTGNIVLKVFSFHLNDTDITKIPNGFFGSFYVHIYSGMLLSTLKKPTT